MSKDGQEVAPNSPWEITRFEFVYFDPLHKRWQIWQEEPLGLQPLDTSSPQFYRRQFHQLLLIIRQWFAGHLGRTESLFQLSDLIGRSEIEFEAKPDRLLAEHKTFWESFLDHCETALRDYGVRAPDLARFLREPALRNLSHSRLKLHSSDALDLISVLPILRDWDLFGCWYRAWTNPHTPPCGEDPFPIQASAGAWTEPFYIARLRRTHDLPNGGADQPLPYEVLAQTICCDLSADQNSRERRFPERDFFDASYCLKPTRTENLLHYRAYGYLYDRLQESLTKTALYADSRNSKELVGAPPSYIISYPVTCVGRTHFLQIQVTSSGGAAVPIGDLWTTWLGTVHSFFWTPEMKQFLSEELQRMKLSTFQALWSGRLGAAPDLDADSFVSSLCSNAPILVPVRSIAYGNRQWAYSRTDWIASPNSKPAHVSADDYGDLGAEWTECLPSERPEDELVGIREPISWTMGTPKEHKIDITLSSRTSDRWAEVLTIGRAKQIFEQQITVGVQVMGSIRARAEKERTAAQSAVHVHFANPSTREMFRSDQTYISTLIPVPAETFGVSSMLLGEVFAIGWPIKIAREKAMGHARRWTFPICVSHILGVGAVKAITHGGKQYWTGNLDDLRSELSVQRTLFAEITFPDHLKNWREHVVEFLEECISKCPSKGSFPDDLPADLKQTKDNPLHAKYRNLRYDASHTDYGRMPNADIKKSGKNRFVPYFPVISGLPFDDLHASIPPTTRTSGKAFLLFEHMPPSSCKWANSKPAMFRNVLAYKFPLATPDLREALWDGKIWDTFGI